MLELNSSFLWIFFLLWILYFALNRIFFGPVGRIIAEREGKAAADSVRQEEMVAAIEAQTRSLEGQLGQARLEAQRIREEWQRQGEAARARAIAGARERSTQVMAETIAQLDKEIAAAERELEAQIAAFSDKIKQAYA
jgi:F-type H+-transporting ATPase subunit b